jgi:hypothetical protein
VITDRVRKTRKWSTYLRPEAELQLPGRHPLLRRGLQRLKLRLAVCRPQMLGLARPANPQVSTPRHQPRSNRGQAQVRQYASGGTAGIIDHDGWLDTGDIGHLDEDGYLFLAGRSDDVINRGGEKIYPREIEDFLLAQPGVWSVAVVAARDEVLGARPVAYVVPAGTRPGQELTAASDAGRHGRFLTYCSSPAAWKSMCIAVGLGRARRAAISFSARRQQAIDHLLAAHTARFQRTAELSEHVFMPAPAGAESDLLRGSRFRRRRPGRRPSTTGETGEAAGTARPRRCRQRAAQNATSARLVGRDRPERPAGPGY